MSPRFGLLGLFVGMVGCGAADRVVYVVEPASAPLPVADGPFAQPPAEPDEPNWGIMKPPSPAYAQVVNRVSAMVSDASVQAGASRRGLAVQNVNWEDTGRFEGSSVGPNISDLTLQVRHRDASGQFVSALMPVIRFPNFTDRTGDVPANRFFVRTGNEQKGGALHSVALTDMLRNLKAFASVPESIHGSGNLLADRDSHFLVSAQAVFLPIPKEGKASFNPVLFNYQSAPGAPAVLTILVTRQGTSVSVIENKPEDGAAAVGLGQELYFNNGGQRAAFTAERKSDVEARIAAQGGPRTADEQSALARGADVLFLVQVPLVHARHTRPMPMAMKGAAQGMAESAKEDSDRGERGGSNVEQAVLGHGPNLGPYNEGHGLALVRDARFPVRITVQFYKATSNGVVDDADLDGISRSIGGVYEHADFVGSLVMPDGDPRRPTAWQAMPRTWFPW